MQNKLILRTCLAKADKEEMKGKLKFQGIKKLIKMDIKIKSFIPSFFAQ